MSVKDIRSNLSVLAALQIAITSNGTSNGFPVDTRGSQLGLMLSASISNFTDGVYDFTLEESVDSAFTAPIAILDGSDKLIGTLAGMQLTADSVDGDVLPSIGVISTLRYVRLNAVASGVTAGADVSVSAVQEGELKPVQ